MAQGQPIRHNKRLVRMLRLFRHIRFVGQPVTYRRNRVVLHPDGPDFFQALFSAIRSAERYILLEYYLIRSDATGAAFAAELLDAHRRGVQVFLIYDYIGCVETPSAYFRDLARHGVRLVSFNVPSFKRGIHWFDKRDHRKMAIIDGRQAFLGGFNIGDEYAGLVSSPLRFRDVGFSIVGNAVHELERIFAETWQMERDAPPPIPADGGGAGTRRPGRANVIIVSGGPHHRSSYIRSAFLAAITSASESVLVVTPYFVPGPRIIRSLLRAVRRGVRVRILLSAKSDVPLMRLVGRSYYTALLKGGIEICELEREVLHAKVMLIDGERTVIGSANLDQRSFHRNFEINGIIDNTSFGRQIALMLEQDFRDSRVVTLADHERRGKLPQILEKLVNLFAWFL
ncbi:cardiolipin synthase B [Geobacter sp. FeAm09]|uniref:phospholipase D-like domain-containing protein n=1 Tax=Geobacter sp. FeAm09 TaxID=2597769 RepID=UPI0011ECC92D|nr:phospholipase D-like domain-containing protein [Geobacter sp. FeAm09]QEM69791.1 cardiolipin synthase B [Geobacter sp. FeAm09]